MSIMSAQNMNGMWKMTWTQRKTQRLNEVTLGALPRVPITINEHTQDICMLTDTITETYELAFPNTKAWWVTHGDIRVYSKSAIGYDVEILYSSGKLLGHAVELPVEVGGYVNRQIDLTHSQQMFSVVVIDSTGRVDRDPMEHLVYHRKITPIDYMI